MVQTLLKSGKKSGQLCTALFTCRAACVVFVLAGGISLSVAGYHYVHRMEKRAVQDTIDGRAREQAVLVRTTVLRSLEALHATAALFQTKRDVHRSDFHAFVSDSLIRHRELQALGYSPRVLDRDRAAFEKAAREDGEPDFALRDLSPGSAPGSVGDLVPSAKRAEYFPVRFLEPEESNRRAIGFSLDCSPQREQALKLAKDSGSASSTPPLRLVQEPADGKGFLVFEPVFSVSAADGQRAHSPSDLLGYASAVFRFDDLLGPTLTGLSRQGFNVHVIDSQANSLYTAPAAAPATEAAANGLTDGTGSIEVAGSTWFLQLQPTDAFVRTHLTHQARVIFAGGILLTLLLAAYLYRGLRQLSEVEKRVGERTVELSQEIAERKRAELTARQAEAAARRAERNYRSIVENSVEGIFQTSADGRYISANRALARIYGFESPEHLMRHVGNIAGQIYVEPSRRDEFIRLIRRDGEVSNFESQIYKRDGSVIWISENARVVHDDISDESNDGSTTRSATDTGYAGTCYAGTCYEGTVVDITARKSAEQALLDARDELEQRVDTRTLELACTNAALQVEVAERKRAEEEAAAASRAKSQFLANMSHEIRTPMNAILGYAQLVHRDRSLAPAHAESISTILNSGRHLMELIDDILDLSKIEAGHIELHQACFNLAGLMHDIAGMFRHRCQQKSLLLKLELPDNANGDQSGEIVRGDQQKLTQVLINLLGNAVKFTDHGQVSLRVTRAGEDYRIAVSDTGIGIPPAAIGEIFEPFQQAHGPTRGGSGLGLAISARHVELMGGTLRCESTLGAGSTFSFTLHLPTVQHRPTEHPNPMTPPMTSSMRLGDLRIGDVRIGGGRSVRAVVVDDLLENRQFLGEVLSAVGCDVHLCASGAEALECVARLSPQIVFLDMMMPEMDGHQTARHLMTRHGAETPCLVATTAAALTHQQQQLRSEGFADVLIKPLRMERVYLSLSTLLGIDFVPCEASIEHAPESDAVDAEIVSLPRDMRTRLRAAAERYSITDLRELIDEIDQLGPEFELIVSQLKDLMRRYDMQAVARFATDFHEATLQEAIPAVADSQA